MDCPPIEARFYGAVIAGHKAAKDWVGIPAAIFTDPEIATVGLGEQQAKEKGIEVRVGKFPFAALGRAMAVNETEGFIKVLIDPDTKEILGAHAVGAEATELIHELLLARTAELLPEDIATMIHAHPTLSEAVMEAMRAAEGWAIHI